MKPHLHARNSVKESTMIPGDTVESKVTGDRGRILKIAGPQAFVVFNGVVRTWCLMRDLRKITLC